MMYKKIFWKSYNWSELYNKNNKGRFLSEPNANFKYKFCKFM